MMKTKTPRPRAAKSSRRAPAAAVAKAADGSSPSGVLSRQLEHVSLLPFLSTHPGAQFTPFVALLEESGDPAPAPQQPQASPMDADEHAEEKDGCILSQDFFCTPDYITPDAPQLASCFEANKENTPCPKSPEKSANSRSKRYRRDCSPKGLLCADITDNHQITPVLWGGLSQDEPEEEQLREPAFQKKGSFVSQSAVALRCRVMPPPCIKNPYLNMDAGINDDIFCGRQYKSPGFSPSIGDDGLSRYRTDFHEIEQIGRGNFSVVFKVLKRIDGCLYAVKRTIRQLHNDRERRQAVKEVQALAALGSHENIVGYFTSWFENEQLYIQMELCDNCLSMEQNQPMKCEEALELLYQICKGLDFIHQHGIAHLDVKPDNIYVRHGVYKLGDFGCAALTDGSLAIEEGDSRYMPPELLKEKVEHPDKVDIFSLGAAIYELIRGSQLPGSGPQFISLREGKTALLPGCPMQFQNLIKSMMDPDPMRRPSAKEILGHPIFDKLQKVPAKK